MLSLKKLTVSVANKKILNDIDFTFEKGKTYAIMGPNGSGKSTLAHAVMGHPAYSVNSKSRILFNNKRIDDLTPDKRAQSGIFLSFQTPLPLSGVTVFQLLRLALSGKKDPLAVQITMRLYAKALKIPDELLQRSLNEGASGGEKKKLEVLQAAVLDASLQIYDEVDTGVDVDALKTIAEFIKKNQKDKTYILITHYNRILKYLKPDYVLVLIKGKIAKVGDYRLAKTVEQKGYEKLIQ